MSAIVCDYASKIAIYTFKAKKILTNYDKNFLGILRVNKGVIDKKSTFLSRRKK